MFPCCHRRRLAGAAASPVLLARRRCVPLQERHREARTARGRRHTLAPAPRSPAQEQAVISSCSSGKRCFHRSDSGVAAARTRSLLGSVCRQSPSCRGPRRACWSSRSLLPPSWPAPGAATSGEQRPAKPLSSSTRCLVSAFIYFPYNLNQQMCSIVTFCSDLTHTSPALLLAPLLSHTIPFPRVH